jgi:hypothetical protein
VSPLRRDDLGQIFRRRVRVVEQVWRADPDPVTGADVAVVREYLQDRAAGVPGGAAGAAALRFVAVGEPVRFWLAHLDHGAGQQRLRQAGDGGE